MTLIGEKVLLRAQGLRDLPVLSVVRTQGLDLLKSKNSTRRDMAAALKFDQVLSAKILRLVNSASYGLQRNVSDVETALSFLGDHTLQMLFLGSNVFSLADTAEPFCIGDFWLHNYMVAVCASEIALMTGDANPAELFSCGLLHDLGKLALWKSHPEIFCRILDLKNQKGLSFFEAENALSIPGHHVIGEEVGRAWSLPFVIRKTMRFHHRNVFEVTTLEESIRTRVAIVILANHIVKVLKLGSTWGAEDTALPELIRQRLNIDGEQLRKLENFLLLEVEKVQWLTRLVNISSQPKI